MNLNKVTDQQTLANNVVSGLVDGAWFGEEFGSHVAVINGHLVTAFLSTAGGVSIIRGGKRLLEVSVLKSDTWASGVLALETFAVRSEAEAFIRKHVGLKLGNA